MKNSIAKYRKQVVLLADAAIISASCIGLFLLTPNSNGTGGINLWNMLPNLLLLIACVVLMQVLFKTYDSLWRYAESREYLMLVVATGCGALLYFAATYLLLPGRLSGLFTVAASAISMLGMLLMRFVYRGYRRRRIHSRGDKKIPAIIIGAGDAGERLISELLHNPESRFAPYCLLDDDLQKQGKRIHGVEVRGKIANLSEFLEPSSVTEVIIALPSITGKRHKEILELCTRTKCHVWTMPSTLSSIQSGDGSLANKIREVRIEDLLGRDTVTLENPEVRGFIGGKVVMVTGGGGSIGSELCRQIAGYGPKQLIVLDVYENNAYDLQQELRRRFGSKLPLEVIITSVRDEEKINAVFERYRPQIVFHAAAHKHVPLMEASPDEAIKNNVFGTWHVVCAAERFGVEKFVLISTDKAVNPTNIMGASKRMCEMILQSRHGIGKTSFSAVRFGNVLGSNGSVVPLFRQQIAEGGPVTVTDKRIIRYFMTIPEAASLVLCAGAMADSGEVFVLDMGSPVRIIDLAENLIRLSGKEPYQDIEIVETGLRPGEKLYEELLIQSEELLKTSNEKIFIERQHPISPEEMRDKLALLERALADGGNDAVYRAMRTAVPTFHTPEEVNSKAIHAKEMHEAAEKKAAVPVG